MKDYANKSDKFSDGSKKGGLKGIRVYYILLLAAAIGSGAIFYYYHTGKTASVKTNEQIAAKPTNTRLGNVPAAQPVAQPKQTTEKPLKLPNQTSSDAKPTKTADNGNHYDFYKMLPKMKMHNTSNQPTKNS